MVDILAIGVHPDDVELCASGTLLKHIDLGYTIALCDMTHGELGTRGSGPIRLTEADTARQILGIEHRVNLGMRDGFFEHNEKNLLKLIQVIRHFTPKIVLANAPHDRHPDHGRASKLVSDACFYAGLPKIETLNYSNVFQKSFRPQAVYHYIQDRNLNPDFVVDITPYMDKKIESILAYKTQFYDPQSSEPETPISSQAFLDFIKAKNRTFARDIGVEYAEGFKVERTLGVKNLFDLS